MNGDFNENNANVPSQDSTDNIQSRDTVGNKADTSAVPSSTTSLVAITKKIYDEVVSMSDASELFGKSGPSNVEIDDDATYALELYDVGDDVPTTGEITPGNYQIDRIRDAALTNIVASTPASESTGKIYCSEVFSTVAGWAVGDLILVTFSGGSVVHAGSTTVLPNAYFYSRITREESIETEVAKIPKSDAAVTWNGTALQSIQDKAEDALEGENLDHLQAVTTVAADMTAEVVDGSVLSRMLSKTSDTSTYTPADASQEMLSDKLGAFTGDGGADQNDSTKASLDLVHTDIDAILSDIGDASGSTLTSLYAILGNPSASLAATILDGVDGRVNTPTLNGLLGVTDAAGRSINGNVGDFQAQTNLQTLLASLGIPDTLNKPLYTCLVTDRLDHATFGLSAMNTDLDAILANQSGEETISSYDLPNDTAENTAIIVTTTKRLTLNSVWLDFVNLAQDVTIKVYHKIDGTTYRQYDSFSWSTSEEDGILLRDITINGDWKLTITSTVAQGAIKAIPYNVIKTTMEA